MSRCIKYYVNKNRNERFPSSYGSLFVSTSQPHRPVAYNIFLVLWWVQDAVKQAELLLIRICQFIPDFRIYFNYLSHIKSECSFIYIFCWEKVVNTRGHSQQAQTTPRLFVTVRGSCRSSCCSSGSVLHQPCSCTSDEFYSWQTSTGISTGKQRFSGNMHSNKISPVRQNAAQLMQAHSAEVKSPSK